MVSNQTRMSTKVAGSRFIDLLGDKAGYYLDHKCKVDRGSLHLPGPDFIDRVFKDSNRNSQVLRNLNAIYSSGRLSGTGYVSILPVDQ